MAPNSQFSFWTFSLFFVLSLNNFVESKDPDPAPFAAKWSDQHFGPDGPWQAVRVTLGEHSEVNLYPGNIFQSWIINDEYCSLNKSSVCYASKAGFYNKDRSNLDGTGSDSNIVWKPKAEAWMRGMDVRGSPAMSWVDTMQLLPAAGGPTYEVPNVSLALLQSQMVAYPSGQWYPSFAGCLGVGASREVNQSFGLDSGSTINASLVPGSLWTQGKIPSNSFSMHIGSVSSQMPGSLWFGGYDQNRLIGDVLVADNDFTTPQAVTLEDISIDVIQGASPFNFTTQDGLLATGNRSLANGLPVGVDGCSPYLTLPKSTCDNIASHLPVTYEADLGLYLWDIQSPKYSQIVSSASALSFTFLSNPNTKRLSIRVPFVHLNLTLSEPLVESPIQYFPCFTGGPGKYYLGRAFLQDAFLGANWGTSKWWLGQASGPKIQAATSVVSIAQGDTEIKPGNNNWEESWNGAWKALTDEEARGSAPIDPPVQTGSGDSASGDSSSGLSGGAIAGIAIGGVVVLAIIAAAVVFWRRRMRKRSDPRMSEGPPQYEDNGMHQYRHAVRESQMETAWAYGSPATDRTELDGGREQSKPQGLRAELP